MLRADPPRGLRLEEAGDQLGLVSAPDCAGVVERIQPSLEIVESGNGRADVREIESRAVVVFGEETGEE